MNKKSPRRTKNRYANVDATPIRRLAALTRQDPWQFPGTIFHVYHLHVYHYVPFNLQVAVRWDICHTPPVDPLG